MKLTTPITPLEAKKESWMLLLVPVTKDEESTRTIKFDIIKSLTGSEIETKLRVALGNTGFDVEKAKKSQGRRSPLKLLGTPDSSHRAWEKITPENRQKLKEFAVFDDQGDFAALIGTTPDVVGNRLSKAKSRNGGVGTSAFVNGFEIIRLCDTRSD